MGLGVCHRDMGFLREGEAFFPQIGSQREADLLYERSARGVIQVAGHGRQGGGGQLDLDVGRPRSRTRSLAVVPAKIPVP